MKIILVGVIFVRSYPDGGDEPAISLIGISNQMKVTFIRSYLEWELPL